MRQIRLTEAEYKRLLSFIDWRIGPNAWGAYLAKGEDKFLEQIRKRLMEAA